MPPRINKYQSLYKWMIIPMVIMQIGIFKDYWGDLSFAVVGRPANNFHYKFINKKTSSFRLDGILLFYWEVLIQYRNLSPSVKCLAGCSFI